MKEPRAQRRHPRQLREKQGRIQTQKWDLEITREKKTQGKENSVHFENAFCFSYLGKVSSGNVS